MKLSPIRRRIERPVGFVLDSETVIGEWAGRSWDKVPRKAHLYANAVIDVREKYRRGELTARRWVRGRHRGYGRITGWTWDGPHGIHTITNLRGDLNDVPAEERPAVIIEWAEYMRGLGANVSSPSSTTSSVVRAGIDRPLYIAQDSDLPIGQLVRGSRIEHRGGIKVEYGPSFLWDIAAAFPAQLIALEVPSRRWREHAVAARSGIPNGPGFGHAVVWIPRELLLGPLPDRWSRLGRLRFPVDDALEGVWSFDELRAAEQFGCTIMLTRVWTGASILRPFAEYGELLKEMRTNLSDGAYRIAKRGAVGQVGSFAREGQQLRSRFVNDEEQTWKHGGYCVPDSLGIHAQVTGGVRAQLYREGIGPHTDTFVSCHTDGVILTQDDTTLIGTGIGAAPGDWAIKRIMGKVMLLDAQRYAYTDERGDVRYSVAGIPAEYVERFFMRKWTGSGPRPRPERANAPRHKPGYTVTTNERVKIDGPRADN